MFNLKKVKNILLINDTEDDYHFGCTATSYAIKNKLRQNCKTLDTISVQEIWQITNPPKNKQEFFSKPFIKQYIQNNQQYINKIKKANKIVINGEGTILGFSNRNGTQNLLFLAYIAQLLKKNISIINHSCFPLLSIYSREDQPETISIYKTIYSNLSYCCVRDMRSLAILNRIGITNAKLGFDCLPIYIHSFYKECPIKYSPKSYIVLSGGIAFAKIFKEFLEENISKITKTFKKKIIFLMSHTTIQSYDDIELLKIIEEFNNNSNIKIDIYWAQNVNEFLSIIQNAFFQISGRFHHSIAALFFGTPFLVYASNSPKTNIFNDFGDRMHTLYIDEKYDIPFLMQTSIDSPIEIDKNIILELANNNFKLFQK